MICAVRPCWCRWIRKEVVYSGFVKGSPGLPAASKFGVLHSSHPQKAIDAAHHIGWLMAAELRAVGVDFSFAPVLDLQTDISQVIGDRAFSDDPLVVGKLAFSWVAGAREVGIAFRGKTLPRSRLCGSRFPSGSASRQAAFFRNLGP